MMLDTVMGLNNASKYSRAPPAVDSTSLHGPVHGFCEEASEGQGKSREDLGRKSIEHITENPGFRTSKPTEGKASTRMRAGARPSSRLVRVGGLFVRGGRVKYCGGLLRRRRSK